MFSSIGDQAQPPFQLAVLTQDVAPKTTSSLARERSPDGSFEECGKSSPSTLVAAETANSFDVDTEALKHPRCSEQNRKSASGDQMNSDCSVWPGQAHWREKARAAERKNRSCRCLSRLSKRANIAVKVAIGLLVVGVAVAVGFGISKSV